MEREYSRMPLCTGTDAAIYCGEDPGHSVESSSIQCQREEARAALTLGSGSTYSLFSCMKVIVSAGVETEG